MYYGVGVSKGVANANVCFCKDLLCTYEKKVIDNVTKEVEYAENAFKNTTKEYEGLYELAKNKLGMTVAAIIQGHRLMVEDAGCRNQVTELILQEHVSAEWAVQQVFGQYIQCMRQSGNLYQKARIADFEEVLGRVEQAILKEKHLLKKQELSQKSGEVFLAMGRQFSVEDILILYEKGAVGLLDLCGEEESHALVIAKSFDLPMIIQLREECVSLVGQCCTMDGAQGSVSAE